MAKHFYRIEHKTKKIGVYNCAVEYQGTLTFFTFVMHEELGHSFCGDYHATPRMNGLGKYVQDSARYGFASLVKLKRWFGTEKRAYALFAEYGFVLRRYTVPERFDSDRQSIAMIGQMENPIEISFDKITKTK